MNAITVGDLARDPSLILRLHKARRTRCEGCGELVYGETCRKCRRQRQVEFRRRYRRPERMRE